MESNVLSGVTATIYEIAENDGETKWDASTYGQSNDQLTGVSGGYAWDVPSGTWQVKFTKEGYRSAQTEALTVPLKKTAAVGDTVAVTLSGAYNYAGTELAEYSSGDLTVAVETAALKLNYETQIAVLVGEAKDPRVTVQVLGSSGRPIPGLTVTAAIEDDAYAAITTVQGHHE